MLYSIPRVAPTEEAQPNRLCYKEAPTRLVPVGFRYALPDLRYKLHKLADYATSVIIITGDGGQMGGVVGLRTRDF